MKIIVLLLLILCSTKIFTQTILYETINSTTDFYLLIPHTLINMQKHENLSLNLNFNFSYGFKTVLSKQSIVNWNYTDSLTDTEYLKYHFQISMYPGEYDLNLKVQNYHAGIALDKNYNIFIPQKSKIIGNLQIDSFVNNNLLFPSSESWSLTADSVHANIRFSQNPVKLDLYINEDFFKSMKINDLSASIKLPKDVLDTDIFTIYAKIYFKDKTYISEFKPFSTSLLIEQRYTYRQQLQQLRYIMTQNEYDFFRTLKDEELPAQIELFWLKNDPSPHRKKNEYRETFYKRILFADEHFPVKGFRAGWQTDRGMIYIKYGEPDLITVENFPIGKYPVIIWSYYKLNRNFYFDDKRGFGHYELREKWYID